MFRCVPRFAAVLFVVVVGLAPAAAEERPFSTSGAGIYDPNYGAMYARFEGTHLGKANFYGYLYAGYLDNSQILEIPVYLTAANGDRLYLDSTVDYVIDYDTGIGIAIGTLTFTGGTGRFQDATGSADVMFVFDLNYPEHFLFLIDGSIDY